MSKVENMAQSVFNTLYAIDARDRAQKKDTGRTTLTYLPWATTYSIVAQNFDDMEYGFVTQSVDITIEEEHTNNATGIVTKETQHKTVELPYIDTPLGLIVKTWVKIGGVTKEMYLPVYDSQFKAMKSEPYTYSTKTGDKTVPAATIGDVYKSIMRCFAKNLSMWGVGLHFWTKEDAPETVLKLEKLIKEIDDVYLTKKKKGFADEELLNVLKEALPEDLGGNYHLCENEEMLSDVKKALLKLIKPKTTKTVKEKE